jgi:hypothetical protein
MKQTADINPAPARLSAIEIKKAFHKYRQGQRLVKYFNVILVVK